MVFVLGPEHAVRDRAVLDAGGRPGTTRAVLVDYGKDVGFAFALGCRAAGDRLGLDDTSCLIFFDAGSGVRHAKPPVMVCYEFSFLPSQLKLSITAEMRYWASFRNADLSSTSD